MRKPKVTQIASSNPLDHNQEGLPLPRLQLRWEKVGATWDNQVCVYELVLPLNKYDIRAESSEHGCGFRSVARIKISETKVTSGRALPPIYDDGKRVESPFRDGAHAQWDSECLQLPVFVTCGQASTRLGKQHVPSP